MTQLPINHDAANGHSLEGSDSEREAVTSRKPYVAPRILSRDSLEAMANVCPAPPTSKSVGNIQCQGPPSS